MRFILASNSPRRKELLENVHLDITVEPADVDESGIEAPVPSVLVMELASLKAANVAARHKKEDVLVIGGDTVVAVDNRILGKPKNEEEAKEFLKRLSGRSHEVYTGIAVARPRDGKVDAVFEKTTVRFRALSEADIEAYVLSREPMDKAGAYGIQGLGSLLIEGIDGDYFNVVGLPVCRLGQLLREEFDVELLAPPF